jgi:hypothetical protein
MRLLGHEVIRIINIICTVDYESANEGGIEKQKVKSKK